MANQHDPSLDWLEVLIRTGDAADWQLLLEEHRDSIIGKQK